MTQKTTLKTTQKPRIKRLPLSKVIQLSALISLVTVTACQAEAPALKYGPPGLHAIGTQSPSLMSQGKITSTPLGQGNARLTVTMQFKNSFPRDFSTQAVDCTNHIADLRVKVIGLGMGELLPQGADSDAFLGDYTAGECGFSASFDNVPVGNARIITVEAYDVNKNNLTGYSLSGLIDVKETTTVQDPSETEAEISFRSTAAGMLAKSLVNQGLTGEALFSGMTAADLQGFVDRLIFNAPYNSTLHGIFADYNYATHPLLLNYEVIAQHLVNVNGDLSQLPSDPNTYTLQASRLNVENLSESSPQTIRVNDPASRTFAVPSPDPGGTTQLIEGVLPGTWHVNINNGSNTFSGILSFAPNITTQITLGSTPSAAQWTLMAQQPETANINAFQKDPIVGSNTHMLGTTKGAYLFGNSFNPDQWSLSGLANHNVLSVESGFDTEVPRQNFFAGTEGQGLFKTTDRGVTWSLAATGNGFDTLSIYGMHARPDNGDPSQVGFLFAATSDGVVEYRLASEPSPWSKVNTVLNGDTLAGSTVSSLIQIEPVENMPYLVITVPEGPNAGVYVSKSANPGDGWYKIDGTEPNLANAQPYRVSLDDQTPAHLYVMGKNGAVFGLPSSDIDNALNTTTPDVSGLNWTSYGPFDSGYGQGLLASESQIYAATTQGVKGQLSPPISMWTEVSSLTPLPNADVTHLENIMNLGIYGATAFTRGGIAQYGSTDWSTFSSSGPESNAGLKGADISTMHADEIAGEFMYVGTRHAGVFKYDNNNSSYARLPSLPTEASKEILDLDQDGIGNLLALTPSGLYILENPSSGGGTWIEVDNFPSGFNATHLEVDPGSANSTVYISSAEQAMPTGIYTFNCSSGNCHDSASTANWIQSYTLPVHSLFALNNTAVYAGAEDNTGSHQVIKSINNGVTWDALSTVSPLNSNAPIDLLYSTGSRLLAISTAEGTAGIHGLSTSPTLETSWVNLANNLFIEAPEQMKSLTLGLTTVYVGLSRGGIRKLDLSASQAQWGEAQWVDYSQPQTNQTPSLYPIRALTGFPAGNTPVSLWAVTSEKGLYRTTF